MGNTRRALSDTLVWWPLGLGAGIAAFFQWPYDPPLWMGLVSLVSIFFAWAFWGRRTSDVVRYILLALTLFSAGFSVAAFQTTMVYAPKWRGGDKPVEITADIVDVTSVQTGLRLLLHPVSIENQSILPEKIRVVCRACTAIDVPIGARIKARAVLSPPAGPARENGFDYRFNAYFQQLGAIGFTYGKPEIISVGEGKAQGILAKARQNLTTIVSDHIKDNDTRALAIALLTGVSTNLPDDLREAYQASGLAHIYSVSGLHLGFVAGFLFFLFRGAMALWPSIALRYPTKKIAAVLALAAVTVFTFFAGDAVPTWRSLIMIALTLLAVMTDRFAFSLRVVALASLVLLVLRPDYLFSISFQLSFAAVTVLIAWVEWAQKPNAGGQLPGGLISRHSRIVRDVLLTSLLASLATLPFILYYFGRVSPYAIFANLVGVPLTGFIIMPLVLLVLVAFLFGLAGPLLTLLAPALWLLNEWTYVMADLPYSDLRVAAIPASVVVGCAMALYLVCVYPRKITIGILGLAYSILLVCAVIPQPLPYAYISEKGLFAYVDDKTLWVSSKTKDKFVRNQWLIEQGLSDEAVKVLPREGMVGDIGHCDRSACVLGKVAYIRKAMALPEYCRGGYHVVVPSITLRDGMCPETLSSFDHKALRQNKTSVLRNKGRWRPVTQFEQESNRIWERP